MAGAKWAITCNGPGETAGWLRPLLRALYTSDPELQAHVFYVPDDYATGAEPGYVRRTFPQAHVYGVKTYLGAALGRTPAGMPARVDGTLYLGGDLLHAARLHRRFGGRFATYRFLRPRYADETARSFAVDEKNAATIAESGIDRSRIEIVGNLAIDGAAAEAASAPEPGAPLDGILFMPGSRHYEVEELVPFFFTAALAIRREDPNLPVAFGISPFTNFSDLDAAIQRGGDPRMFSKKGRLIENSGGGAQLASLDGTAAFPVLRSALSAAKAARLTVTIPGTKVIELASIGAAVLSCTPLNIPERVTINGPLTYIDRIPFAGVPLKRAVVTAVSRRFVYHTQPNMDLGREVVRELHGTLTPGRVARVALECWDDEVWRAAVSEQLRHLYAPHGGAAARMARSLLELSRT